MNPYLKRLEKRNIGDTGRASERKTAKRLGAKLTPGSGNKGHSKGDATLNKGRQFRIECKSTKGVTLPIDLQWLAKIRQEAIDRDSYPMLTMAFTTPDGTAKEQWAAIPLWLMEEILEELDCARQEGARSET